MKLKENSSKQKIRGAYYTPNKLANAMVQFFASKNIKTVLEPSCGDGVFLDSLKNIGLLNNINELEAVEIETSEAMKVSEKYKDISQVKVLNQDFFDFYKENLNKKTYDLIIGNPPYIRYQYLKKSQRDCQAQILTSHGMKSNKLINVWVAFMVSCVQLLSKKGKIAFVIPAEILQVAYAEDLRLYLTNHLSKITLITFKQLVFPHIEQEIIVFIGEKGNTENGIRIIEMDNLNEFDTLKLDANDFQPVQHVKEKWTKYFINNREIKLIQQLKLDNRFARFSEYGRINVGITTGNNNYFSITEETTNHYKLKNATLPLIGRSSHTRGIYFTKEDWNLNKTTGKSARLVYFPNIPYENYPQEYKNYILAGESNNEHKGYKCSIRDRWYIVPSVWIPDAFFLRRSNLYPKFVLNACDSVSTDTMHRIKFNDDVEPENVLLSYYNSISFAFTEICGRSYGGGVLEILPGEMSNILLPKIEYINPIFRKKLLKEIDNLIRNNDNIEKVLDLVDNKILVELLNIDKDICCTCRNIWKKLQQRRLRRS